MWTSYWDSNKFSLAFKFYYKYFVFYSIWFGSDRFFFFFFLAWLVPFMLCLCSLFNENFILVLNHRHQPLSVKTFSLLLFYSVNRFSISTENNIIILNCNSKNRRVGEKEEKTKTRFYSVVKCLTMKMNKNDVRVFVIQFFLHEKFKSIWMFHFYYFFFVFLGSFDSNNRIF